MTAVVYDNTRQSPNQIRECRYKLKLLKASARISMYHAIEAYGITLMGGKKKRCLME